ncbi:response regulator transcription factor [Haloferula sp. BvORR071]|uniref:response regulator transcription factor n=1 Tax=Haloferula sp. BvORR071 TaxID=1396141 RepID=UPI000554DD30|nr:response regulator transcription factor [Haloferula sp. BvORR071]
MRVLVVEDSQSLRSSLRRALQHDGHAVDLAANGMEGLAATGLHSYDVIVLDVMMPELDGLGMLTELRMQGNPVHVLLLTARDTLEDKVSGFRAGADDYLVKPFALDELLVRVVALGRRAHGIKKPVLSIGPLELDLTARTARHSGAELDLTAREWRLLECLAQRAGQVVPRTEIEESIYDELVEPMSNVVDTAVYGLRRKIGRDLIQTRRGLGYVLAP